MFIGKGRAALLLAIKNLKNALEVWKANPLAQAENRM